MIHARDDYNRIQDPAGKIPADEPVFLLRAQDKLACKAVMFYASLCEQHQAPEVAAKARDHALRMADWPAKKVPDLAVAPSIGIDPGAPGGDAAVEAFYVRAGSGSSGTGDLAARVGARETPEGWVLFGSWMAVQAFRSLSDRMTFALLKDPVAVHAAMLRGEIATPRIRDMLHVYGADVLAQWDASDPPKCSLLDSLIAGISKLPQVRADEFDGHEADGTPQRWRNRSYVSVRKLTALLQDTLGDHPLTTTPVADHETQSVDDNEAPAKPVLRTFKDFCAEAERTGFRFTPEVVAQIAARSEAIHAELDAQQQAEPLAWCGPHLDAAEALNETRKAVAMVIGADPDTWPSHGNAPLAIASCVGMREGALKAIKADPVTKILEDLLAYVEDRECRHENTHRGGAIWTICDDCDQKWADDTNPFTPYVEPEVITRARNILKAG